MAPKKQIRISKDVNLNDNQEDPPTASKKERLPRASKRARVSKRMGISKARKDLQKDHPTSSSAETTRKLDSCSHTSSSLRACDVCEELLPEICGVPFEITQRWLLLPKH